jgi:TonB-dependent receptor
MKKHITIKLFQIIFLSLLLSTSFYAQGKGGVIGTIIDSVSMEPLVGANIMINGTVLGAASDIDGKYRINNVSSGNQILRCSYLGYKVKLIPVNVISNRVIEVDLGLASDVILSEDVVVTGMLEGQQRAINQQLTSNTIVNIVSKDKIEELPDQNAAETLGRLPGISVQRDAGEGQKIVIRGLSPKYNAVMINDEGIPATDPSDRSVDLSMISPDILEGIEVYKALTPDQDANSVGGRVNFTLKKAPSGFRATLRGQTGYNNHESEYGQYKTSLSTSNRFFEDKLGVVLTGSLQRANRSSDILDAGYIFEREQREGEERAKISVNSLNLGDRIEVRDRYGLNLALDYDLNNGYIVFNSLWSRTDRDELRRRKRFRVNSAYTEYEMRDRQINTTLLSNALTGDYDFDFIKADFGISYSQSNRDMPFSHTGNFRELGAFNSSLIEDQGPELIPLGARNNIDETFFQRAYYDEELMEEDNFTSKINLKIPYTIVNNIGGYIKLGGKYREKSRDRDKTQSITSAFGIDEIGRANTDLFDLDREGRILISNFIDPDFDFGDFLEGEYEFTPALDVELINKFGEDYRNEYFSSNEIDKEDYTAKEKVTAAYIMAELNLGPNIMLLPGIRYEHTQNNYKSITGTPTLVGEGGSGVSNLSDTSGVRDYGVLLPMIHIRYKPLDWFDIRLAYTNTLSRPDYFNLVSWERISHLDTDVERGNPDLKHTKVWNYDLFLSFYNRFGLVTLGGFYKDLKDIDYIRSNRIIDPGNVLNGYQLTQPVNSESITTVYGFEFELQTNLMFLPSPFDGIVLYINYTHIFSETFFPLFEIGPRSPDPPFTPTIIDTVRSGRMPGQADDIANFAIGYEKGSFKGRLSMVYQGESLQEVGTRSELDGFTDAYIRWDLILQQDVMDGFGIYFNINNLSNTPDKTFLGIESFATHKEYFGWTADLGIKIKIK